MSTLAEQVVEQLKTDMDNVYDAGYQKGKSEGGDSYYDMFWDNYQENGNRTHYYSAFSGYGWNDNTFKPKYPITIVGNSSLIGQSVFSHSRMTEINVDISADIPTLQLCFNENREIVTIKKIILLRNDIIFDRTFQYVTDLESITFEGVISKNISFTHATHLSNASVQNIIDCLADLTGQTAQTLTFHADVKAKLTEEQIATITSKNWTLA